MTIEEILQQSAVRHRHLCPRQVLGARMALYAAEILGLELPRADKRLLVISETDGCAVDGIIAATACRVGSRTLRILDFGKVAAAFVDTRSGEAIRIVPRREARLLASAYAQGARNHWEAMLNGYQVMPAGELLIVQSVRLDVPLSEVISKPSKQAICEVCGEEIINGRELMRDETILCRTCAGEGFYYVVETMVDKFSRVEKRSE
jgi:formylmethanofuran dehydrogenase subunit E